MRILQFGILFLLVIIVKGFVVWRTDFFSLASIQIPFLAQNDSDSLFKDTWPQTFRYLARGRQCFAFESKDGRYVLKFFDRTHLNPSWKRFLSASHHQREMKRWADRVHIYPESYRIALEKMAEETGLLIVHQGHSSLKYPIVELVDKASRHFSIDLNTVPFVLQKKGTGKLLNRLSKAESQEELTGMIEQFLAFHSKRIGSFIADGDRDVKRNYAWNGDDLLYIDPARFSFQKNGWQPERYNREWWGATYRLRRWISKNAPERLAYFDEKVNEYKNLSLLFPHTKHAN